MTPFLDRIAEDIHQEYGSDISSLCLVAPTRRAVLFMKAALARRYKTTLWSPRIVAIQDFVRETAGGQYPDSLPLIFDLYQAYLERMRSETPDFEEPFERFYSWGEMLLRDFDETDKYCAEAGQLFANILDLKEIDDFFTLEAEQLEAVKSFWQTLRGRKEGPGEVQQKFLRIWQILQGLYHAFRKRLSDKGCAYDGMAYRRIAEELEAGTLDLPYQHILFIGFNALSVAEERIMHRLLLDKKATVYWDADRAYLTPGDERRPGVEVKGHLAGEEPGKFIREYHKKWSLLDSRLILHDMATERKDIYLTGVPLLAGQAQYLGNLLRDNPPDPAQLHRTVVVLADEHLLYPVLYALPGDIARLNITMGFALKQTRVFHLLMTLLRMLRNARSSPEGIALPYREVLELLNHPFLKAGEHDLTRQIHDEIIRRNMIFVDPVWLLSKPLPDLLKALFQPPPLHLRTQSLADTLLDYLDIVFKALLADARARENPLESEYIFQFYLQFNQLREVLHAFQPLLSVRGFANLFREAMQRVRIPFQGEPLDGMQLMGFLETRVLDFDKVYILAANEGNLPDASTSNSFIPYALRKAFGLPTFEERDAIYAYHFYRLIQRAREVHLVYNTIVNDSSGSGGEVSRFIRQIRHFFARHPQLKLHEQVIATAAPWSAPDPIRIPASEESRELLRKRFVHGSRRTGISSTAMTTYLGCRLRFYFRYVAGIKEPDKVEETMETNTFGQVLHMAMQLLYEPLKGQELLPVHFDALKKRVDQALEEAFRTLGLGKSGELEGKNILLRQA
ncbi:MAG: hypothetical protein EAZ89_14450, partial [Bacteroidetes bacterium]